MTLLTLQLDHFADDPGVGWHLRTGEFIATYFQIPDYDPFLATNVRRSWISDQWLSDLMLYLINRSGGWALNYGVFVIIYILTFFAVLYAGIRKITGASLLAVVAAFLAFKLAELHFIFRASMLGFFFFSYVYVLLYSLLKKLQRGGEEITRSAAAIGLPKDKRLTASTEYWGADLWLAYAILPILFVIWANMHPSFILGLVLLFLAPISIICDRLVRGRGSIPGARKKLLFLAVLCLLATLINPYGLDLHSSIFSLGNSTYFMSLHQEWMSPDFKLPEGEITLIIFGLIGIGIFLGGSEKLRWGFFEFLLVAVFGYLGLKSVRMLPFFGIAASVPLVLAVHNLRSAYIFNGGLLKRFLELLERVEARERSFSQGLLPFVVTFGIFCCSYFWGFLPLYSKPLGPSPEKYPYGALEKLENLGFPPQRATIFAPPEWGGFITLMGVGALKPVIDDRNSLLGEEFYKHFYNQSRPGTRFLPYVRSLGATHLLLNTSSPIIPWLQSKGAREIYSDTVGTIFDVQEMQ